MTKLTEQNSEYIVRGGFGLAFEAKAGQYISINDLEGAQAGDFVALNRRSLAEGLSPIRTRRHLLSLFFGVGDTLLSNNDNPMLKVVYDTIGVHDSTIPACDPTRYAVDFGVVGHRNCLEICIKHLWTCPARSTFLMYQNRLIFFKNSPVLAGGRTGVVDPPSKAGDEIVFLALIDVVCALSPCPQDIIPGNDLRPSDMKITVSDTFSEKS